MSWAFAILAIWASTFPRPNFPGVIGKFGFGNGTAVQTGCNILVDGNFNNVNGLTGHGIARLRPNGAPDESLLPQESANREMVHLQTLDSLVVTLNASFVVADQPIGRTPLQPGDRFTVGTVTIRFEVSVIQMAIPEPTRDNEPQSGTQAGGSPPAV